MLKRVEAFNHRCKTGEETTRDGKPACPITMHTVPHLKREINPWNDFRCYGELKKLIARIMPDVVHTHSSKAGILGRAAAWTVLKSQGRSPALMVMGVPTTARATPRVVHTIHGPPFMPVQGTGSQRLKTRIANAIYTYAERYAAKRCHAIISVADAMTRQFLERGIGRREQYVTVYSGMEVNEFLLPEEGEQRKLTRAGLGLSNDDFVIGTVSRLAEHKGHDDLLDALHEQLKANRNWKLLWAGDGWWRSRLIEKARSLGLQVETRPYEAHHLTTHSDAHIVLTGLVPPEDVPPLIRAMDVLAHPSYREGLPRTVPQALLCSVCPVAYDVDGTGEICREMETGRLVPPGNLDKLREAIVWCADQPVARAALALRGRIECAEKFDAHAMVTALERVYER